MNTVAQLVIAAILNFLGMVPEVQDEATKVKADTFVESGYSEGSHLEDEKVWHTYVFIETGDLD